MSFQNPGLDERRDILVNAKTIAVVGLSDNPYRASYMISQAMQQSGYRIIPVNPSITEALGEKAVPSLTDLEEPVDVINVFRRSEHIMPIAEDAVKYGKCKILWLQSGIYNEEAANYLKQHGFTVIMDQCIKVDHAILVRPNKNR